MTCAYKKTLDKGALKRFRSQMWSFRRRPEDLTEADAAALDHLFDEIPLLGAIYHARWELTSIFDHAPDRETAARQIDEWIAVVRESDMDWEPFVEMYERHREGILNYFIQRQTSGPVEGLNNKVRVVLKRTYGMKSVENLWSRLILEVNHIGDRLGHTIDSIRTLAHEFRAIFCRAYT